MNLFNQVNFICEWFGNSIKLIDTELIHSVEPVEWGEHSP